MTYRLAIITKNGSMRSSQAAACAMLANTSVSYSPPRMRTMPAISRCVSVNSRIAATSAETFFGLPSVSVMTSAAIRHNSGEGGAHSAASESLATLFTGTLRDAGSRRRVMSRHNRNACNYAFSPSGEFADRFAAILAPASGVLAHPLTASIRLAPVGAGRVDQLATPSSVRFISAFQRGSL